jgi:oligopeptide transport system ATP-binding protein
VSPHILSADCLLEVSDLRVDFVLEEGAVRAVDGVSFHIGRGETVVVVGESGSGKSVTSLALLRLVASPPGRIVEGKVWFRGRDGHVRDLLALGPEAMRRIRGNEIAMIFQEPMTSLNPVYSVGEQIVEVIELHQGKTGRAASDLAAAMLDLLGIPEPRRRMAAYPHQLSGGMRQRVMIAMALCCRPSLLIADEPTTALDVTIQAQILELIKRLQHEFGMAVMFITHNLGVAAEIADRILVMYAGRVVEEGSARAIFHRPRMPYTMGLLGSVPRLGMDRTGSGLNAIPGNVPDPLNLPPGCAFEPRCKYAVEELCGGQTPPLEPCELGHWVRCFRWQAIVNGGANE